MEKRFCENRDVARAFSQRWESEHQTGQAKIEILTEPAFRNSALQIAIRGGYNPHIHRGGDRGTDAVERPLL